MSHVIEAATQRYMNTTRPEVEIGNMRLTVLDRIKVCVAPEYKCGREWTVDEKSLLIESLISGIPVPAVTILMVNPSDGTPTRMEVVDGTRRIQALTDFIEGRYALHGLRQWSELNGARWDDLSTELQGAITRRPIQAVTVSYELGTGVFESPEDILANLVDRLRLHDSVRL